MKTFHLDAQIASRDYDGWFGKCIGPKSVQDFLSGVGEGEKCTIEINSPGGDVVSGIAIANSIKNSKAHVVGHIVGIAASMASVIACACDEVRIEEGAFLMIHNPWSCSVGDSDALRKDAALLDQMKASMLTFYRGKFPGKSSEELAAIMDAETWMTGTEAKANGFACEVISSGTRMAACATEMRFAHIPEAAAKFLAVKTQVPEAATTAPEAEPSDPAEPAAEAVAADPEPAHEEMVPMARFSGMQAAKDREISELRAAHAAESEKFAARISQLEGEISDVRGALAKAEADASSAKDELKKSEGTLAEVRKQLAEEQKKRAALTAGVLVPPRSENRDAERAEALAKCKSAEERIAVRDKFRALMNK